MRDFKGMKRQRGRNRKQGGASNANATNPNRSWDSQGPENIKVRGNAQTVYERYMQLARDASASGDRVLAENYTQHAEHYFRVLRALQPQRPVSEIAQRELAGQGFDIDFEDESGAQAAAILAAAQAETERLAREEQRRQEREQNGGEWRPREEREPREAREQREPREPREPRAESEAGDDGQNRDGSRRESRRERWERRRDERVRRIESEQNGDAPASEAEGEDAPVEADAPAETPAPRARRPRREEVDDAPSALPGFLTRSSAPAPAAPDAPPEGGEAEAPAPRRRAPRRKAETPADEG